MSLTKTPLEKRRAVFFQTGLMAALAFALAAFTWTTPEYGYRTNLADLAPGELLIDPAPISPMPTPPAALQVPQTNLLTTVNIVKNLPDPNPVVNEPLVFEVDPFDPGDWGDEGYEEEATISLPPTSAISVQRSARYADCENEDRLYELQCTHNRMKQLVQDLAVYPRMEHEAGISGNATILFVIDEKGNVVNAEVERCSTQGFGKAAKAAVEKLPQLKPAMQLGKPRAVYMKIPVTFTIK